MRWNVVIAPYEAAPVRIDFCWSAFLFRFMFNILSSKFVKSVVSVFYEDLIITKMDTPS